MARRLLEKYNVSTGDVLLLHGGDMIRVLDNWGTVENYRLIHTLKHSRETEYCDVSKLLQSLEKNLGQGPEVLASFYAARSIHERLNNLKSI